MFSSRKTSAPSTGYNLTKSLRFRSSASAYLGRTPATATNRQIWTWSGWVKRGIITSGSRSLFASYWAGTDNGYFWIGFDAANNLEIQLYNSTLRITTQVFADPSAWYHFVVAVDTTQATASNRVRLYVNGAEVTSFSTNNAPTQNLLTAVNYNGTHFIGSLSASSAFFDGEFADYYLIDGQQLTPSSFGATSATTGVWQPIAYSGTYGTNGFHLTFANTTSTTTLGYDTSGNSNNWTTNNISLTAGSTYDSMNDVPTLTSATASNYAVWNPLKTYNATFTNGNLDASVAATSGSGADVGLGGFGMSSGKWYWEVTCNSITAAMIGISDASASASSSSVFTANGWAYYSGGQKYNNNSGPGYAASFTNGDIIGVALDMDAGTLAFYKNGASQGVAYSTGLTGKTMIAMVGTGSGSVTQTYSANFGQRPFAYTAPSGYNALNTYNLPTPAIVQGNKYMDANLWTGNSSTQSITNSGSFQPDMVWIKARSTGTYNHQLFDAVRGTNKTIYPNLTNAEFTDTDALTAFNSNGFTMGAEAGINNSGDTYVAWQWKANGSGSSNTNGSITSTVSASITSGFSVVTYTGTGTAGTIGHGLGVAPSMIIVKSRSATGDWPVYHSSLGNGSYTLLDTTAASASSSTIWNSTSPTSSVFSVGINTVSNTVSVTYVAYCFTPIAGFSAFGSYTGGSSTLLPFVYCGFRPRFIMIKNASVSTAYTSWYMIDTARLTGNISSGTEPSLWANLSAAEGYRGNGSATDTYDYVNILSNGFQVAVPTMTDELNTSGNTYIYMAFAENPFKYANAR